MYVSRETSAQTHERLLRVIAQAEFRVYPGLFAYTECSVDTFSSERSRDAIAFVRDDDVWSVLVPADSTAREPVRVFAFHFAPELDNSGFVGWLATNLKTTLGTGVLVVCGQNSARGGIFDYWGVPAEMAEAVLAEIHRLREAGKTRWRPNMQLVLTGANVPKEVVFVRSENSVVRASGRIADERVARSTTASR